MKKNVCDNVNYVYKLSKCLKKTAKKVLARMSWVIPARWHSLVGITDTSADRMMDRWGGFCISALTIFDLPEHPIVTDDELEDSA